MYIKVVKTRLFDAQVSNGILMVVFSQPQFESLFKKGQTSSETCPAKCVPEHLSYAQFIVQSENKAAAAPPREGPSRLSGAEDAGETELNRKQSCPPGGQQRVQDPPKLTEDGFNQLQTSEATLQNPTTQSEGTHPRSDPSLPQGPKPVGSGSSIVVSPRQVCTQIKAINGLSMTFKQACFCP